MDILDFEHTYDFIKMCVFKKKVVSVVIYWSSKNALTINFYIFFWRKVNLVGTFRGQNKNKFQ